MKILIAAEIIPPTIGGPATYLASIVPSLQKRGHEVVVVSFGDDVITKQLDVDLYVISLKKSSPARWLAYTLALFKYAKDCDVILSLGIVSAGLPAVLVSKLRGIPVVLRIPGDFAWEKSSTEGRIHNMSVEEFYSRKLGLISEIYKKLQRFVLNRSTIVFATSQYQSETPKSLWGANREVKTIYSSMPLFKNSDADSDVEFAEKRILLSVGRLIPLKGYATLIPILQKWLSSHPDWLFLIIGDGPEYDNIVSMIDKYHLQDRIKIIKSVKHETLSSYYRSSDIFLQYSEYEGLANTMLEAIYFNLPVIGTRRGGTTEVLEQYPNGKIVEFGSDTELLEALDEMLDNNVAWSDSDREAFFNKFSYDNMIDNLERLLINSVR